MRSYRETFYRRGASFLGCRIPILCGAMTWVSDPVLVSAVCNEGAFACLAGGSAPPEILGAQIEETRERTSGAFAVNLITISPAYEAQLQFLARHPVSYVVFAGGIPKQRDIETIKATGAKTLCFAQSLPLAQRLLEYGADALVLEGSEAGGHVGQSALSILLQQVLFAGLDVPIFVAGGIATGQFAAHLLLMGAAGVQLGTRFATSTECTAHPKFKQALLNANPRDAIVTVQYDPRLPVAPVRSLVNEAHAEFGKFQMELIGKLNLGSITREEAQRELEHFWLGGLRNAVKNGDIESGSVMAGQSVGLISRTQSVHEIIAELEDEIERELARVHNAFQDSEG
ncbi:MAG: nitronate monooxygenase [Victivallales bacterium]|nr:nitronate monooxygenase [Victivallales bacterium]